MQKILKEYNKKSGEHIEADYNESLMQHSPASSQLALFKRDKELTLDEKKYLLAVERGDIATVKSYLEDAAHLEDFNINAKDPLGRSALHIAIEYENIEMIELLLNNHVDVGEAILHAINEEFVEAVEMLLSYQDHGKNYLETLATEDANDAKKNVSFEYYIFLKNFNN
jgi:ankyrin repeat protein